MANFRPLDEGAAVAAPPAAPAHADDGHGGDLKKKPAAAAHGGKSEISGAVFNLANAVRRDVDWGCNGAADAAWTRALAAWLRASAPHRL
jgi:hypothetical protein